MSDMLMTCERVDAVLADFLEGDLGEAARHEVESHVRTCVRCTALLRDLDAIRRDAAALPALAPTRDLWTGIAERIETPVVAIGAAPRGRRAWWRTGLAAAGLVIVTAGVTYSIAREQGAAGAPSLAADSSAPTGAVLASNRPRVPATVTYESEIAQLREVLESRRDQLDPRTVAIVENSLTVIDKAIADARAALAADSTNPFLGDQLNRALDKKLGLLRTVALLPART